MFIGLGDVHGPTISLRRQSKQNEMEGREEEVRGREKGGGEGKEVPTLFSPRPSLPEPDESCSVACIRFIGLGAEPLGERGDGIAHGPVQEHLGEKGHPGGRVVVMGCALGACA